MGFVKNFINYAAELEERYGKEASGKILLIKSMILTYRPLEDRGIRFPLPMALVTDSRWNIQRLSRVVRGSFPATYGTMDLSDRDLKDLLDEHCSEVLLMQHLDSNNTASCLEKLAGITKTGLNGRERFRDPVIVTFPEGIPVKTAEYFAGRIRLDRCRGTVAEEPVSESGKMFILSMTGLMKEKWQIIDYKISKLSAGEKFQILSQESPGAEVWYTVRYILETLAELSGEDFSDRQECLEQIRQAESQIVKAWEMEQIWGDWCEIFRNLLFVAAKDIPGILNKRNLKKEDIERRGEWPIRDEKFYYVPETLFKEICSGIKEINILQLKEILADQGVIRAEGKQRTYYAIKVSLVTVEHEMSSPRMVWIYRNKVDLPGMMAWEDQIRMNGKGGQL